MRLPARGGSRARIRAFARTHGLSYADELDWPDPQDVPVGAAVRHQVVHGTDGVEVQVGNLGEKYWLNTADFRPGRRGYVAVRHGVDLPHLYVRSGDIGALTMKNVALTGVAIGTNLLDMFSSSEQDDRLFTSAYEQFAKGADRVDAPPDVRFSVRCEPGRSAATAALLTPAASDLLTTLTTSFEVEAHRGWLYAYSNYGDLATADRETWEWAFGAGSRLVDLARLWGAGETFGAGWPGYTAERVERPHRLDGALGFLKRRGR